MSKTLSFNHPPLVSVLIRTTGRETLVRSVESVFRQKFTKWRIVIADAKGKNAFIKNLIGEDERILWIDCGHSLGRSAAANVLLDAVDTQFAVFLDDDDWILPDHLEKLVAELQSDSSLVAAYSDVKTDGSGGIEQPPVHVFSSDFDPVRLQFENYLPIHSVLFRFNVTKLLPACRFDEKLKLFEDWDFWLQIAMRGPFKRVAGISAVYALNDATGSGHMHTQERKSMLSFLAQKQLNRWTPAQVVDAMEMLAGKTRDLNQTQQELSLVQSSQELFQQQLLQLQQKYLELQQESVVWRQERISLHEERLVIHKERMALHQECIGLHQERLAIRQELVLLENLRVENFSELQRLNDNLIALYQSVSWRITVPLRFVSRFSKILISAQARLKAKRFLKNSMQAVRMEIRRYGKFGFIRRIPYYFKNFRSQAVRLTSEVPIGQTADLHVPVSKPRNIRLHPDLSLAGIDEILDIKVSIVIPTLNAGNEFSWLLKKLRAQKSVREIEIVIVDSGSQDKTVEWARTADCKVVEILPSEFSHSYARNRGADTASGEYLLFMVQDAYPIGDNWLYGMLSYLIDHADQNVVAASCAEYSRSDSDMMYDAMVNTHYKFLGCLEYDRIGEYSADDHMSLRSRGQLSDVSCLISRSCFMKYRYRGDYAEDLDLGIRLIKDGYRVSMLASVKVIHSHNRPAYYYLKRTFVDVIFLVGMFDDFFYPHCDSPQGLIVGIVSTARHVSKWLSGLGGEFENISISEEINSWIKIARKGLEIENSLSVINTGDERLDDFIYSLIKNYLKIENFNLNKADLTESKRFTDGFIARLDHFNQFAAAVYGPQDLRLRKELCDVVRKTFAATAGGALGFFYLDYKNARQGTEKSMADAFERELKAGV